MKSFEETADLFPKMLQKLVYGKQVVQHKQLLDDILAEHAHILTSGKGSRTFYLKIYPDEPELISLLPLAEHISEIMQPVTPATGFQNRLLHDLMRQAHARREHSTPSSLWEEKRKEIIIGATITSIISAAGVLAYLLHITPFNHRSNTSTG